MRTDPVANQSGLALVLTLLLISFLVAVTMQLMITIDRQVTVSTAQREQVRLDAMVLAGLNLARAALLADQQENEVDTTQDLWADLDQERLAALAGGVELQVTIADLSGRLQVNALGASGPGRNPGGSVQGEQQEKNTYREVWLRLLTSGRFALNDEDQAEALLDAIADWVDKDENERIQGAEEQYYRARDPGHGCRNGTMPYLEELLLVKGMTPEIFYGDKEHEGIAEFVTVAGEDGKINLNTAPLPVLQALAPEMTTELAQELIDFREDKRNVEELAQANWYTKVRGMPASLTLDSNLFKVTGSYFRVTVKAVNNQFSRQGTGVVQRTESREQTLLHWRMDETPEVSARRDL